MLFFEILVFEFVIFHVLNPDVSCSFVTVDVTCKLPSMSDSKCNYFLSLLAF